MLANLPAAGESALLEEFDGRAEQETTLRLAAGWLSPVLVPLVWPRPLHFWWVPVAVHNLAS